MTKNDMGSDPIVFKDVEKQYGGLRPLRIRDLRISRGRPTMLIGFDRPTAEVFVNLITGASLPEIGEVVCLGRATQEIANSDQWLAFVEQFGIVSDRIVLLETMTVAQNLAISFDLELDPVPPPVLARVKALASEVGITDSMLETRVADAAPLLKSRVYLARAIALDPSVLVLEHPSARLDPEDAKEFAGVVKRVCERRTLTTVGLLMDEKFANATGGRLLIWQPASGEMRPTPRFGLQRGWPFISRR